MRNIYFGTDCFGTEIRQNKMPTHNKLRDFIMDDKLKADISKIVDEAVSSRLSNQQATLTFNLENIDAEDIFYFRDTLLLLHNRNRKD